MIGFFDALADYREALRLVSLLRLWVYFIIPSIISLVIGIAIILLVITFGDNFGNWLGSFYPFDFGSGLVQQISKWLGYILMSLGALFTFRYIIIILLAPLLSPLSNKVEKYLMAGSVEASWSAIQLFKEIKRSLKINLRNMFRELFFTILLFLLHFIPFIGWFSSLFILMVQSYYAGFGNMDFTLERHLNYRNSISFVRSNRGLAIGNGLIFVFILMIPLLGLLIGPPLAVVAATIGTVRKLKRQSFPQPVAEL